MEPIGSGVSRNGGVEVAELCQGVDYLAVTFDFLPDGRNTQDEDLLSGAGRSCGSNADL